MSFVLFFRGMLAALLIFAVTIYMLTGSFWTTVLQTVACAILLEIGYFIGVLFLVWRSKKRAGTTLAQDEDGSRETAGSIVGATRKLPGRTFPHRP